MTMPKTDNGTGPASRSAYRLAWGRTAARPALYERLIDDGIAAADARGSPVGHLTARRLAIWLAARPQAPVFAQGLVHFRVDVEAGQGGGRERHGGGCHACRSSAVTVQPPGGGMLPAGGDGRIWQAVPDAMPVMVASSSAPQDSGA